MSEYNRFNAECPSDEELRMLKNGTMPEDEIRLLSEHLATCDRCQIALQFGPLESTGGHESFVSEPADSAPGEVPSQIIEALRDFKRINEAKPRNQPVELERFLSESALKIGQIWRTRFDEIIVPTSDGEDLQSGSMMGSVPHMVIIVDPDVDEVVIGEKTYRVIRVAPIDHSVEFARDPDVFVTDDESPIGHGFLIQSWNVREMLVCNLSAMLGEIDFEPRSLADRSDEKIHDFLANLSNVADEDSPYSLLNLTLAGALNDPVMRYRVREIENTVYLSEPVEELYRDETEEYEFVNEPAAKTGFFSDLKDAVGRMLQGFEFTPDMNFGSVPAFDVSEPRIIRSDDGRCEIATILQSDRSMQVMVSLRDQKMADCRLQLFVAGGADDELRMVGEGDLSEFDENWVSVTIIVASDETSKFEKDTSFSIRLV